MVPLHFVGNRLRSEAIEQLSNGMIAETPVPGGRLRFFAPTPLLQERASSVLTKEPDMTRWLDGLATEAVLWDIGANVGVFSLYAAVRTGCTVLAFEPSSANFHVLVRNVQLNALYARVTAYCVALSGATELGVLNLASTAPGSATSQFGLPGEVSRYWNGAVAAVHGMLGFTLDEFIERFRPPFPTHLKMDVDGLELRILQAAGSTLSDPRLRAAMVEISLTDLAERERVTALMERCGFEFVSQGESQGSASERAANHLFVRKT